MTANVRTHPWIETARLAIVHVRRLGWRGGIILHGRHLILPGLTSAQRQPQPADNDNGADR
jgi:hypothetical protein